MLSKRLLDSTFDDFDKLLLQEKIDCQQWYTNYLSLLQQTNTSKTSSTQITNDSNRSEWDAESRITGYLYILEALMSSLEQNLQRNLSLQLETEIGNNFIDQAEKFLSLHNAFRSSPRLDEEKTSICYFVVAVVLAGTVLERALQVLSRDRLHQTGLYRFDEYIELNRVVNALENNGVLEPAVAQQICFWLSLRQKVLLDQPEQLNSTDIKQMICGIRELLENVVKPSFS